MNGGGNSKGVYNPSNLMLFSYTHNNPVNLVDPDGQETTGEFLNNWAKNVVYEDVKSDRSGILGYSAVFVATVWQYLGAESLSKVADNYYNGRDDVTASDYAWATVDVASAGVGKLLGASGKTLSSFNKMRPAHFGSAPKLYLEYFEKHIDNRVGGKLHGDIKKIKSLIKKIGYSKEHLEIVQKHIEHSIKVRKAEASKQFNFKLDDTHAKRVRQETELMDFVKGRLNELNK